MLLQKALNIDEKNDDAREKLSRLNEVFQAKRQRLDMLRKADDRLGSGDLFEPETNSAFYFYNKILEQYPNDKEAKFGIDQVLEALSTRIWGLIGEQRFDQARAELKRPMRLMGKTQRLVNLEAVVDRVTTQEERRASP